MSLLCLRELCRKTRSIKQTELEPLVRRANQIRAELTLQRLGAAIVPYYLDEEHGWAMEVEELRRALQISKGVCNSVALYVINPGNPTGHVQSRKCIEGVIRFAAEERLFLMADEVYQDSMFGEGSEFVSYRRLCLRHGASSLSHSGGGLFPLSIQRLHGRVSVGYEVGMWKLVNLDPTVMRYAYTIFSTDSCAAVTGQLALELMANPPRPGDPSYPVYAQVRRIKIVSHTIRSPPCPSSPCLLSHLHQETQETQPIQAMLVHNMNWVPEVLNNISGISCQPMMGGAFVFPRLYLPQGAIEKAKVKEAGVCVGPGCQYGQKEGTHHIRLCVMTPVETMEEVLKRLKNFHLHFLKEFF
ncbi:unnamed protein product [Coregonus sp. 'balchen']|nr:unnamed protein product [Coregonus sp. 'balchen']